jgi:FMN phosphatase YigB (HAD superfamily)
VSRTKNSIAAGIYRLRWSSRLWHSTSVIRWLMSKRSGTVSLESRGVHLMPGVLDVLPQISIPMAVWANTRTAGEADIRRFLDRAGIGHFFSWIVTSVDAGARKPAAEFFAFALSKCGLARDEALFVGNQLNTDVAGGRQSGICTVWLSRNVHRSAEDTLPPEDIHADYTIPSLRQLPSLVQRIHEAG